MKPVKVVWVSRHPPNKEELNALENIFDEVFILQYPGYIWNVSEFVDILNDMGVNVIVPFLPIELMRAIINYVESRNYKIKVLNARFATVKTMTRRPRASIDFDPTIEVVVRRGNMYFVRRFIGYRELTGETFNEVIAPRSNK